MAESVVAFLLGKLDQVLARELHLILEVDHQIHSLQDKLQWLLAFLKDADAKRRDNWGIKVWVGQIRDITYQAEDAIDKYMFEIQVQRQSRSFMHRSMKRFIGFPSKIMILRELGKQINGINQRLREISENKSQLGVEILQSGRETLPSTSSLQQETNKAMPNVEEINVVGFGPDAEKLEEKLVTGTSSRAAVSIVGMGGLGKTTLAREVYKSNKVVNHFHHRPWVYVSQNYNRRELLQVLLKQLVQSGEEEIVTMSEQQLLTKIKEHLRTKKYLLVIDDIWDRTAWDNICDALPDEKNGSRIMVTTRKQEVALHVDPDGFIHKLRPLEGKESWELFCSKVFGNKKGCPEELAETEDEIVKKCAGLPLAIVVLGGLLWRKPKTKIEWRKVLNRIEYELHEKEDAQSVRRILALSYDDLPFYLRLCFLYLGLFPEDSEIDVDDLIQLLVAEGFIQPRGKQTMEEVAEDYVEELVDRCMIQVVRRNSWGRLQSCRVHDLMLDLCISQGREDKFLDIVAGDPSANALPTTMPRRVAVHHTSVSRCLSMPRRSSFQSPLRSLLTFNTQVVEPPQVRLLVNNHKLLTVLDLRGTEIGRLPKQIGGMVHLRYLGLRETDIEKLPSSIGKLCNLQTLQLDVSCWVPEAVWKIETLRHVTGVYMESRTVHPNCKGSLQTLYGIKAGSWVRTTLGEFTNLRNLWIESISSAQVAGLFQCLEKLTRLNMLDLDLPRRSTVNATPFPTLTNHPVLYELALWYPKQEADAVSEEGQRPSIHVSPQFPQSLTYLRLGGTHFSEREQLASLASLPNLKILKLLYDAYIGEEMAFSADGFIKLEELGLRDLSRLERWTIGNGAMPCLKNLRIEGCPRLEMLPEGLRHITTLQQLELREMPENFTRRIQKDVGGDWNKVQHIPSRIIRRY